MKFEKVFRLLELHPHRDCKVFRLLSHEFGVVRLYRTFSYYISSGDTRCAGCNMHRFGEVQAHQTSSNILELHPHRDSKVYRLLSHEFGVVRLDQTFSDYIFTGDTRCARNIVFFHMSSGWFDCTEPSLTTSRCLALYCIRVCTCTFCVLTLYNGIALPISMRIIFSLSSMTQIILHTHSVLAAVCLCWYNYTKLC